MSLPTVNDLRPIEPSVRGTVTDAEIDRNGHMNSSHFMIAQTSGVRASLVAAGVTDDYIAQRRLGTFAAEHNLRYLSELRLDDEFSVRVRFLERTDKAIHSAAFLVNETAGLLANVLEVITVHIDQDTRRATSIPTDLAEALDAGIRQGNELGWSLEPRLSLTRR